MDHNHTHHGGHSDSSLKTSAHATLHCMVGCVIGEFTGLAIGITLGLGVAITISLTFFFAFLFGFLLGVIPVMRREGLTFWKAFKVIWLGEAISIFVMEVVMNLVDYHVGGIQVASIFAPMFWIGMLVAIPPGFLAAWPVNYWLLKRHLKACH